MTSDQVKMPPAFEKVLEEAISHLSVAMGNPAVHWNPKIGETIQSAVINEAVRRYGQYCKCIPLAPRPQNFCSDCGGRIPETEK